MCIETSGELEHINKKISNVVLQRINEGALINSDFNKGYKLAP